MLYHVLRPLFFSLPPELAHTVCLKSLTFANQFHLLPVIQNDPAHSVKLWDMIFPNRIGLAAGLDKNADYIEPLSQIGFGFIEVGTVTPLPQGGNPLPRLFRLPKSQAIINRMGFNNKGLAHMVEQLKKVQHKKMIIGANFGKNRDTSLDNAINDYLICLKELYSLASYLVVNISSPNTPGLRDLQNEAFLENLLASLTQEANKQRELTGKHTPLLVKIAPDLSEEQIKIIASQLLKFKIDGVIATNTTISRPDSLTDVFRAEAGGLSGQPLRNMSTQIIRLLRKELGNTMPIIGVGGVFNVDDVKEKRLAGADLVQIYSGLIYEGPEVIKSLISA